MNVGFVGLGRMGSLMAQNLIAAGHALVVHDIKQENCAAAIEAGATWADGPSDLARHCETIISSVPGPVEVAAVMTGLDGILAGVREGTLIIETSTIGPAQSRDLYQQFAVKKAVYLDATVNRIRLDAVAEGRMTIMVGGSAAEFERALPILNILGDRIHHVGATGSGNVVKLLNQMIFLSYVEVFSEGIALGERLGIDLGTMLKVFSTSAAAHPMIADKYEQIEAGDDAPGFAINRVVKDLDLVAELCAEATFSARGFHTILDSFRRAEDKGFSDKDMTVLHNLFRDHTIT
jgi:3-hydroxyisobutyrate dehydrogenase-like beta-hydroxyacid dehydrogenase